MASDFKEKRGTSLVEVSKSDRPETTASFVAEAIFTILNYFNIDREAILRLVSFPRVGERRGVSSLFRVDCFVFLSPFRLPILGLYPKFVEINTWAFLL